MLKHAQTIIKKIVLMVAIITLLFSVAIPTDIVFAAESTGSNTGDKECEFLDFGCQILILLGDGITEVFSRVSNFVADAILGNLVTITAWLFQGALNLVTDSDMSIVEVGWGVSLGIANNFFILILLAIAIATILGFDKYSYKTMLPKFIMVILLINFSMVIGLAIINIVQVPTNFFVTELSKNPSGAATNASQATMNIMQRMGSTDPLKYENDDINGVIAKFEESKNNGNDPIKDSFISVFMLIIVKVFTNLLLIFVFLAGTVYMISRTFMLWMLLMLAPLAWIASLLPSLEKHWTTWWDKFIKWSIFAPAYLFFVYLGLKIYEAGPPNVGIANLVDLFDPAKLIQVALVGFVLLAGLKMASNLGVGGSNFVMNYANSAKGAASKKFKGLREQGNWSAEKLGERLGGAAARGVGAIPILGRAAGYEKAKAQLAKEKLEKTRESNEGRIKNEKTKLASINHADAYAKYQAAIATGDASPATAALAQIVKEQEKLMAMEFKIAEDAARAAAVRTGGPLPTTITITTPSGSTITAPIDAKDRGIDATRRGENIRRTVQNATAGNHSGVNYI